MHNPGRNRLSNAVTVFQKPVNALVLLIVLAVALTTYLYRYYGRYQPFADLVSQSVAQSSDIGIEINDASIVVRSHGHSRLHVSAGKIEFSRDRRTITIDNLHDGVLYDNAGRPAVRVAAGEVVYTTPTADLSDTTDSSLRLTGGVTASTVHSGGPTISTDDVVWNAYRKTVTTARPVRITFPHESGKATANGVVYYVDSHNLTTGPIQGTFHIAKLVQ